MTKYQFEAAFPVGVENHFWTRARIHIVNRTLRTAARAGLRSVSGRILDIGCGPGIVVGALRQKGYDIWGVDLGCPDIFGPAVPYVEINKRAQDLDQSFRETVETLIFLDVIEHISDDVAFLSSAIRDFPNCRCVLVTVPARPELWTSYDEFFGHYRRYTRETLDASLEKADIKPVLTRYFFGSLYVAAMLIKTAGRARKNSFGSPSKLFLHSLAAMFLEAEDYLLGSMSKFGSSLISVAVPTRK